MGGKETVIILVGNPSENKALESLDGSGSNLKAESLESRKSPFCYATYVNKVKRGVVPDRMHIVPKAREIGRAHV